MTAADWPWAVREGEEPPPTGGRLLLWLAWRQRGYLLWGSVFGVLWMLPIALLPAVVGRAVDALVDRDADALLRWAAATLVLGVVTAAAGTVRHWFAVHSWLDAAYRSSLLADRAVRRAGPALTRDLPAGEVITSFARDMNRLGAVLEVVARLTGAAASYLLVGLLLLQGSVLLGGIVLAGGPVVLATVGLLMRPLQRRQEVQRTEAGRLTALGADTVAGLRVLRGIGGEDAFLTRYAGQSGRVRDAGVRLAGPQATLDAAQVLLPGLFVLLVTGLGAHLALAGDISPGELVASYGYVAFLSIPLRTVTEFAEELASARVAAGRVVRILAERGDHPAGPLTAPLPGAGPGPLTGPLPGACFAPLTGPLTDPASGVVVAPGLLTALVSARPEESATVAERLGRTTPGRHGVRWGEHCLDDVPVAQVRARVVVSEAEPHLFSGPVRRELLPPGADPVAADGALRTALAVADAADAVDAVDGGLDGELEERGRSLSGGQRQRLALARTLVRDPEVLVLLEPTSAVDAHTEARIAQRLVRHRAGRTTVVVTASPLLLDQADVVVLLADGREVARGRHRDLLRTAPAYRAVVTRGEDA
ncbi:MAG TPA: ABC transporter ATP-binding protein [Dermatophilaceae bacterium]|nr:ABC transporter ATP-binding protein [Dermatophilaceae bacterium]